MKQIYVGKLGMNYKSKEEFEQLFKITGYKDVKIYENKDKGWVGILGKK